MLPMLTSFDTSKELHRAFDDKELQARLAQLQNECIGVGKTSLGAVQ
jgi:hypothetical protein